MLQPKLNKDQISQMLQLRKERIVTAIQFRLLRTGETFVTNARNNGTYKDHTGNLRGSIGFVLMKNGEQVGEDFKTFPPSEASLKGTGIGPDMAKRVIDEIITKYPSGLVLICVAGMAYAAAVESKNFDVITSSALIATDDIKRGMEIIRQKVNKAA